MTPFWKEERLVYSIYQNKQNLSFLAGPPSLYPYDSMGTHHKSKFPINTNFQEFILVSLLIYAFRVED